MEFLQNYALVFVHFFRSRSFPRAENSACVRKLLPFTCGVGGISVIEDEDGTREDIAAGIKKAFAAELLAEQIDTNVLVILTEVEKAAINWGRTNELCLLNNVGHTNSP